MAYNSEHEIRELLDLYFEGETSLEQEEVLRSFFSGDVPADLTYAKAMFTGMAAMADASIEREVTVPEPAAFPAVGGKKRRRPLGRIYAAVSVAAAAITIAVLAVTITPEKQTVYCYLNGEPVTDIHVAERQAEMAMRLLQGSAKVSAEGVSTMREAARPVQRLERAMDMISAMAGENAE